MKTFSLKNAINSGKIFVDKHSPEILIGLGITGMITSTVMAVKATPKAIQLMEEEKERLEVDELTKKEIVSSCWRCYAPAVITAAISSACILGANSVNARRNAVLATAYNISERTLNEYRTKVVEVIGEEKEKIIRDEIARDRIERRPLSDTVIVSEKGNTLCYDSLSGRYFKSDAEKIRRAENILNKKLMNESYVSLNDFYDLVGLPFTQIGNDLGWKFDGDMIEIEFSTCLSEDDVPCIVIEYSTEPKHDYEKFF